MAPIGFGDYGDFGFGLLAHRGSYDEYRGSNRRRSRSFIHQDETKLDELGLEEAHSYFRNQSQRSSSFRNLTDTFEEFASSYGFTSERFMEAGAYGAYKLSHLDFFHTKVAERVFGLLGRSIIKLSELPLPDSKFCKQLEFSIISLEKAFKLADRSTTSDFEDSSFSLRPRNKPMPPLVAEKIEELLQLATECSEKIYLGDLPSATELGRQMLILSEGRIERSRRHIGERSSTETTYRLLPGMHEVRPNEIRTSDALEREFIDTQNLTRRVIAYFSNQEIKDSRDRARNNRIVESLKQTMPKLPSNMLFDPESIDAIESEILNAGKVEAAKPFTPKTSYEPMPLLYTADSLMEILNKYNKA